MNVIFQKGFLKDIKKIKDKKLKAKVLDAITYFQKINTFQEAKNVKKMKGYDVYYRYKIDKYRIGFAFRNDEIDMICFAHRKDSYRLFP